MPIITCELKLELYIYIYIYIYKIFFIYYIYNNKIILTFLQYFIEYYFVFEEERKNKR